MILTFDSPREPGIPGLRPCHPPGPAVALLTAVALHDPPSLSTSRRHTLPSRMSYAPPSVSRALAVCAPYLSISRARLTIRPWPQCHLAPSAPSHVWGFLLHTLVSARPPPLLHVLTVCVPALSRAFPFHTVHAVLRCLCRLPSCRPCCLTSRPLTTCCHSTVMRPMRLSRTIWTPVMPSRALWRASLRSGALWCSITPRYALSAPWQPLSLAADLRSGGSTGCVAAVHALAMAQAARPLAVPLTPTVSCCVGPSNGVGGTLSRHATL
ncbi:hypothetical protein DENSPDRAFT_885039 [Dentipellis sp. KUC8613]|nr:hypothetical protein DENSPDRAFT_885039 [Dentipellis sp. KUC8613]